MRETLTALGLTVVEDPKLGKLPLRADLVLISPQVANGEWQQYPLWQHLTDQALVEFKSVADPLLPGDFEVLQAVFRGVLESEQRDIWLRAVQTAMALVHPADFKDVLKEMSLTTERRELREYIKELLKEDLNKPHRMQSRKARPKVSWKANERVSKRVA